MIPGDLLSTFPNRQFHTLPGLLDSWAALPNSYPNACMPMQGGSLYHFYDGLWYDPAERRTHYLPCERRTHYRLSQPDTVGIARDGAVTQDVLEVLGRVCLHNNTMGCHFMRAFVFTGQCELSFWRIEHINSTFDQICLRKVRTKCLISLYHE